MSFLQFFGSKECHSVNKFIYYYVLQVDLVLIYGAG